jgi:hypothetical protein
MAVHSSTSQMLLKISSFPCILFFFVLLLIFFPLSSMGAMCWWDDKHKQCEQRGEVRGHYCQETSPGSEQCAWVRYLKSSQDELDEAQVEYEETE